jgi:glycerol-3-phosphate dehydrogenase
MTPALSPRTDVFDADAIVVGGGIYGLMAALEAGKTGRRVIVVERGTVGSATSANWFRILHGGLRYLQTLDLPRFCESVAERRWFQQFAPDLVRPLRFLMPLYGEGMRRPATFRAAFLVDAALAARRNVGLGAAQALPRGRVLDPRATQTLYPGVRPDGLQGGALWYDVVASDSAQLSARLRAQAEALGARVLEGVEALELVAEYGAAMGVTTKCDNSTRQVLRAPVVINAAGPWSAELAERFGCPAPELFRPVLGFNLLLDKAPPADAAIAVSPPGAAGQALFVYPHEGRAFAGTWYAPWQQVIERPTPSEAHIDAFLAALNAAAPSLTARRQDILKVFAGLLPAKDACGLELADRAVILNHGKRGGPTGFYSVSGVKFTTARRVAKKLIRQLSALAA